MRKNLKEQINNLYPKRIRVLQEDQLAPNDFPTMKTILKGSNNLDGKKNKRRINGAENSSDRPSSFVSVSVMFLGLRI